MRCWECLFLLMVLSRDVHAKWVEGSIDTKDNWAFLSRFCFLSMDGQFEYLIEFNRDLGTPNLLLYYDDGSQWPAVYHSQKTCKEKEAVLNKVGQNQIIKLSHWYPDMEISGCVLTQANKEMPTTKKNVTTSTSTTKTPPTKNTSHLPPVSFYDQFLKTTTTVATSTNPATSTIDNTTVWYEINEWTTNGDDVWEEIDNETKSERLTNLDDDVEILFSGGEEHKIKKRSNFDLYDKLRRRRLNAENDLNGGQTSGNVEKMIISCHNSRRFRSSRERWWFIAVSNCGSSKGLDLRYKFLMTNGPDGDFWHEHFSADEFYVLPVLLSYSLAYIIVMIAVVMCSVELKSRHLLHSTYKLFLVSIVTQHIGVMVQSMAYVRYALHGYGGNGAKIFGQFLTGMSELSFLLLLILMAKGYTITRGRLKVGFTVKLTVFMCCYLATYVILFVYQAKAFDPGEVLYLYESAPGYCLIAQRMFAWAVFAYATFFTINKYPEKNSFYCPFFIFGSLWFHAGPLFILTANNYIDKWVRESVVTAILLFIAFGGHIMFLLLTLPVFANKNFPYHVRTTQIGVMEVAGSGALDDFGHNAYRSNNPVPETVIIPLTRRTEELIGSMYQHAQTNGVNNTQPNGVIHTAENEIFTIDKEIKKNGQVQSPKNDAEERSGNADPIKTLPAIKPRRNLLDPLNLPDVPIWSLAKGPSVVALVKKEDIPAKDSDQKPHQNGTVPTANGKKVPPVRNGLPRSGEISTITEGEEQNFTPDGRQSTIDLFNAVTRTT